jgi:DivIVA domain-containing protein
VRSDEVRGKQFSTHRPGYDKTEVDAFVEAAGLRLAAMESRDRPAGSLVSGALLVGWAEWADLTTFSTTRLREAYDTAEVDAFREAIRRLGARGPRTVRKSGSSAGAWFSGGGRCADRHTVDGPAIKEVTAPRATDDHLSDADQQRRLRAGGSDQRGEHEHEADR